MLRVLCIILAALMLLLEITASPSTSTTSSSDSNDVNLNFIDDVGTTEATKYCAMEAGVICFNGTQMEIMKAIILDFTVNEFQKGKIGSVMTVLKQLSMDNELMDIIFTSTVDQFFDSSFNYLLSFVSQNTNEKWKLTAYRKLFDELVKHKSMNTNIINWLQLQHFVSENESVGKSAELKVLLNEIESKTIEVLDSTHLYDFALQMDSFARFNCDKFLCKRRLPFRFLIKQLFSKSFTNIPKIFSFIDELSVHSHKMRLIAHLLTEIELTNQLNYTMMLIPAIRNLAPLYNSGWPNEIESDDEAQKDACLFRSDILKIFPKNSSSWNLLFDNEFYIKNVFNSEYLEMQFSSNIDQNVARTSTEKISTWKFENDLRYSDRLRIDSADGQQLLGIAENDIQDEWYTIIKDHPRGWLRESMGVNNAGWILEIDDMFSDRFRIKHLHNSEYLGVGRRAHKLEMFSDYKKEEANKIEWVLESRSENDDFKKDCFWKA